MEAKRRSGVHPITVAILLVPEFSQLVLTLLSELLRICELAGPQRFKVVLCSSDGSAIRASNGRQQAVDSMMAEVERPDAIVVCASYNPLDYVKRPILNWLRSNDRHGSTLCGVDTGAIFLAESGLLDDSRATLHWDELSLARKRYPIVNFTSALFETDGRYLTSCGSLGTIDFALALITKLIGPDIADRVLDLTVHGRSETQLQHSNPILAKATKLMSENIEDPLSISELSTRAGLSSRQLTRVFQEEFCMSPVQYYLGLRLDFANDLVTKTRFSLSEIALACGFVSLSWFSSSYKKRYTVSPSSARRHRS